MKRIALLLALLFVVSFGLQAKGGPDDDKLSKMVVVIKDKQKFEKTVKELRELKGVKKVEVKDDQKLVIYYDKKELGCCSKIYKKFGELNVEYTLVSNEEYPKCDHKKHKKEHVCEHHGKKGGSCCKSKKGHDEEHEEHHDEGHEH